MLSGKDFVLWEPKSGKFGQGRAQFGSLKEANQFISRKTSPEITQLVEALTAYFGHIGMHEVCRMCFAAEPLPAIPGDPTFVKAGQHGNHYWGPGYGCCKPCGLQGHTGCLSKPLGCAGWMCQYTSKRFPEAAAVMQEIRDICCFNHLQMTFFSDNRPEELTREQSQAVLLCLDVLKRATAKAA